MSAPNEQSALLAELVTALWRIRRRMAGGTAAPGDPMRRTQRDLDAIWDRLTQAGMEVLDHTGDAYQAGKSLKVLAFQAMPEVHQRQIVETLKPTIYFRQEWLQLGEVIVGIPADQDTACSESTA